MRNNQNHFTYVIWESNDFVYRIIEVLDQDSDLAYGYVLEKWNPEPGKGFEEVDSCFGFVGQYSPKDSSGLFDHYIVNELKEKAVSNE
jgi:hypothetical protein